MVLTADKKKELLIELEDNCNGCNPDLIYPCDIDCLIIYFELLGKT